MARLPRLVIPGHAHWVIQRGHSARAVFEDDDDRLSFLAALREAAAANGVIVHAYGLPQNEVQLLLTPPDGNALSRTMQALGRRYVSAYNRRHGRSGTLWDGRFRCAVVEPGETLLRVLTLIDGQPGLSSAGHRSGGARDAWLLDPPELWQLGNTPFEREAAYRRLLLQGLPAQQALAMRQAALGGWVLGSDAFVQQLPGANGRPLRPRPAGRPARRSAG